MSRIRVGLVSASVAVLAATTAVAAEQEALAAARNLYASAAYEDALAILNRVPETARGGEDGRAIEQYRAFCLLALGRSAEAERAIEVVVAAEPMYRPSSDLSPRVRQAFTDVRRRVLPSVIQRSYAEAKANYDQKNFIAAAAGFARVLEVMSEPDAAPAVNQSPLADLKTLAVGFHDLAKNAATPPPLPAAPPPVAVAPVVPPPPRAPQIFSMGDAGVIPPGIIRQDLPAYPGVVAHPRQGVIEVIVDANGLVESAVMRVAVSPAYDRLALTAARGWQFRPATMNGAPVKYRKTVQITIKPETRP